MLTVLTGGLAAASMAVALTRPRVGATRLTGLRPRTARPARAGLSGRAASALAGLGVLALVGLPAGLVLGAVVALGGPLALARLEPASARREREQLVADLPLVLDLLAACLSGGASLAGAAAAVSAAIGGPCGARLSAVTDALAVGTPAAEAWLALTGGRSDDPLASAARVLGRAAEGGAPVSAAVARLVAEARAGSRAAAAQAARRVGVLVVAPLGLCFLPAFVLLGIIPVVIGLATPLLATF